MARALRYAFAAKEGTSAAEAKEFIIALHTMLSSCAKDRLFLKVGPIRSDKKSLKLVTHRKMIPIPDEPLDYYCVEIVPVEGWVFELFIDKGCPPMILGLCRYPQEQKVGGEMLFLNITKRWACEGSVETIQAAKFGWEHLAHCHAAVAGVLRTLQRTSLTVEVEDQTGFLPDYNPQALFDTASQYFELKAPRKWGKEDLSHVPFFLHDDYKPSAGAKALAREEARALKSIRKDFGKS